MKYDFSQEVANELLEKVDDELAAKDAEIARLKEHLESVMSWIDNWEPNFMDDDEWKEEEPRIRAALQEAQ